MPEVAPLMRGRIVIAQSLYAIATATCIVFPTWVSISLIFLVQLNYVIAPRIPFLHRFRVLNSRGSFRFTGMT
jgi:hypothetical protein